MIGKSIQNLKAMLEHLILRRDNDLSSPRISNRMVNNVSVPCTEIMGTHL